MSCQKNENCINIYNDYSNQKKIISNKYKDMSNNIDDISNQLNELEISEDYLGNKVKEVIEKINLSFSKDIENVENVKKDIDDFVDRKMEEHLDHYNKWKVQNEDNID